jgi:hypothetical protein
MINPVSGNHITILSHAQPDKHNIFKHMNMQVPGANYQGKARIGDDLEYPSA